MHRAPALLELGLCTIGQSPGLALEPLIDLGLRGDVLIDVACLVAQVEDDAILHGFVVLVGVDVRSEGLDAALLLVLEQWRSGEADQRRVRQQFFHRRVEFARLGAVAFIHKDEYLAFGAKLRRQVAANFFEEGVDVAIFRRAKLVYQRADQPFATRVEHARQVAAARRAIDVLADALEDLFDLLV